MCLPHVKPSNDLLFPRTRLAHSLQTVSVAFFHYHAILHFCNGICRIPNLMRSAQLPLLAFHCLRQISPQLKQFAPSEVTKLCPSSTPYPPPLCLIKIRFHINHFWSIGMTSPRWPPYGRCSLALSHACGVVTKGLSESHDGT